MTPTPTPAQAVRVLEILDAWLKRDWWYEVEGRDDGRVVIGYAGWHGGTIHGGESEGVNHFDALCQATTVMQVLLAEHPEKS